MKILIAPNAFKGSLSPIKAAELIEQGINKVCKAKTILMPISDGGDGIIDVFSHHFGGKIVKLPVYDALLHKITASYLLLKNGHAIIEIARACGLASLKSKKLKPMQASSYGAGQLILSALKKKAKTIYIGLGGSASNDAGTGLASALGVKFFGKNGDILPYGVKPLLKLHRIDSKTINPKIKKTKIFAITDVTNPLLGRLGSARIYGPQKGADAHQVEIMAKALNHYVKIVKKDLKKDIGHFKAGASAGGLGAGVYAFLNAKITPGADFILKQIKAEEKIKMCDMVITAEGCLDRQTFYGKAPYELIRLAKKHKKPVLFIAGRNKIKSKKTLNSHGITAVVEMTANNVPLKESIQNPKKYLLRAVAEGIKNPAFGL
ncbi:MAG TPA: glycerate kinase [Elusimicrobiales bacterium]|nr:glycerate kinase [Elusimicrobiales bacterium]